MLGRCQHRWEAWLDVSQISHASSVQSWAKHAQESCNEWCSRVEKSRYMSARCAKKAWECHFSMSSMRGGNVCPRLEPMPPALSASPSECSSAGMEDQMQRARAIGLAPGCILVNLLRCRRCACVSCSGSRSADEQRACRSDMLDRRCHS